jgi:hypothetical protein
MKNPFDPQDADSFEKPPHLSDVTLKFGGGICEFTGAIYRDEYQQSGATALEMLADDGEPIGTLSTNIGPLPKNHVAIKDYSENEGMFAQLIEKGIVRDTGKRVRSGFVEIPVGEILVPELRI